MTTRRLHLPSDAKAVGQSKRMPKINAAIFDLDDTLITHAYGRTIPQPRMRDASVIPLLTELGETRVKLFIASAYIPGIDLPGLIEMLKVRRFELDGDPQRKLTRIYRSVSEAVELPFPTNTDNCIAQKKLLMRLLGFDSELFDGVYSFPYVHQIGGPKDEYVRGKQKIFRSICNLLGTAADRILVVSDEEGEKAAALELGMTFALVERATTRWQRIAEGRISAEPELRDLLLPYLF